ncbi:hypothetical protein [Neisseria animalis]|uniref:Type II toxin-antitoxin system HicA family toxin n=1 Tax=Neisseria animalis TaxID=492 RepID=A0A5P3MTA2_NEIAN|nr:hypothetical protein [Neisseria animalis]QEY24794.1 hypothetical protein D0T90_10210 [Neisseria animalis]ROW31536.1 hypothetical protein CGZ60_09790 [Neisseria animalis]VEE07697.1 Uncharacterised protein [Neisseria animalis]
MKHPDKHIQAAIEYALQHGWQLVKSGSSSHAFCRLKCIYKHSEHQMSVWSTPQNPENHAKQIIRKADQCKGNSHE